MQPINEDDRPVKNDVCKSRMDAQKAWMQATFTGTLITLALILVQVLRGH